MQMIVSIVEDMEEQGKQLEACLNIWGEKHGISIETFHYCSAEVFLQTDYCKSQLVFLDIDLKTMSGIEVARRIRQESYSGEIIFLTAFSEYVFEGYHVRALDYLLKPVSAAMLEEALKPVLKLMVSSFYICYHKKETIKIAYTKILAFISSGHYVDIKTKEKTYRQRISIHEIERMIPDCFLRSHRTIIVNIAHITKICGHELYLDTGEILPISSRYLQRIQNAFLSAITTY